MARVTPEMANRIRALLNEYETLVEIYSQPTEEVTERELAHLRLAQMYATTVIAWAREQLENAEQPDASAMDSLPIPATPMEG